MTTMSTLHLAPPSPIKTNHRTIDKPHVAVEAPRQAMAHACGHGFVRFHATAVHSCVRAFH
jgi:hypothetical protein